MIIRAFNAGTVNGVASPARQRSFLSILNQSTTATIYVAFDTPAVAAATAGQITIGPIVAGEDLEHGAGATFEGIHGTPWNQINIVASTVSTPVTILES